jgi:hypothetical protein
MIDIKAGVYKHFKGKYYLVLGLARHSETDEKFVAYIPLYTMKGPRITVRPIESFFEMVEKDGMKQPRFLYVGSEMPENGEE